jgi:integrase
MSFSYGRTARRLCYFLSRLRSRSSSTFARPKAPLIAQRERWILRSPFATGDSLISLADENKRERILTREEESKLLAACDTSQRAHLKAILICALDAETRQDEIFSLRWKDVDLENRLVNLRAFHTKTMKERQVAITTRLAIKLHGSTK